jgi:hypothetical protein
MRCKSVPSGTNLEGLIPSAPVSDFIMMPLNRHNQDVDSAIGADKGFVYTV